MSMLNVIVVAAGLGAVDGSQLQGDWCLMSTRFGDKHIIHHEQWQFGADGRFTAMNFAQDMTRGSYRISGDVVDLSTNPDLDVAELSSSALVGRYQGAEYRFERGRCDDPAATTGDPAGQPMTGARRS